MRKEIDSPQRGVRWDPALGEFTMRCPRCAAGRGQCFWPITTEFWDPSSVARCRACNLELKRIEERQRRRNNPELLKAANRRYYRANHALLRFKDNARKKARRAA